MPKYTGTFLAVRRYISGLRTGQIFTTQDVVGLGHRTIVDRVLSEAVRCAYIERLTNGVFWKPKRDLVLPPVVVAEAKARAFGKQLHDEGVRDANNNRMIFRVCGRTTSFTYDGLKIILHGERNCIHLRRAKELADHREAYSLAEKPLAKKDSRRW